MLQLIIRDDEVRYRFKMDETVLLWMELLIQIMDQQLLHLLRCKMQQLVLEMEHQSILMGMVLFDFKLQQLVQVV